MKVDSKHITHLFDEIRALLGGVAEIFREGYYIEESVNNISENINTLLSAFAVEHLAPAVKAVTKRENPLLRQYETLLDKKDRGEGFSVAENEMFFMAQLYTFIKRELRAKELPVESDKFKLSEAIIDIIVQGSRFDYSLKNDYVDSVYKVTDMVAKEVIEYRKMFPQFEMNFAQNDKSVSKNLVDLL